MRVVPWRAIVLVVGGILVGLAVAGLPSQREDPPLRVRAEATTTTTIAFPTTTSSTTTTTAPTTTTTARTTRTTARP